MIGTVIYVVMNGVRVEGAYTNMDLAMDSLPKGTDWMPCPDPTKGINGFGKDRELRIRKTTLFGLI